jgi:succinyl-diaminopimelate desuccinylase
MGGVDRATLLREVAERSDELVDLCSELIRTPSPNPPGDTRAIAALVERKLTKAGLSVQRYAPKEDSPNLVTRIGSGRDGPSLLINGHLDHFPPASGRWTSDPYGGEIVRDRLIGVGATDMRAGLAVSVFLAETLASLNVELAGHLTLMHCSDEETGGEWGTEWVLNNVPDLGADACLIGDQSGAMSVALGEKGVWWLRLTTHGRRGHGAYMSHMGAARLLVPVLQSLLDLEQMAVPLPPGLDVRAEDGRALVEGVTVNLGTVHAGEKINLAPDVATAEVDIRIPVGMSVEQVRQRALVIVATSGADIEVTDLMTREPNLTDPSAAIVEIALRNATQSGGADAPRAIVRVGSSDARFFRDRGIPTIVLGASPATMGGIDENVSVAELRQLALIHAGIVMDMVGGVHE